MLFIVVSVFLATMLAVLALYLWTEARRETLPHRFREVSSSSPDQAGTAVEAGKRWISALRKRISAKPPGKEELVAIMTGQELQGARLLLNQAGYRSALSHQVYWWVRVGLPIVLFAAAFSYGKIAGVENRLMVFLVMAGTVAGVLLPNVFLRWKIRKRQEDITDALPDALDLLVVCVEAGLGLNAAFVTITDEFKLSSPVLSEEFDIVNREMVAGKPRQEALRALADRTAVEDVKSLVAMLIQTEKLGTSLAQSLRVHSDSLRTRRRQRAEEAAAKTTIKLIFPLVFLLFPALFIVILGPGVIQVIRVLFPGLKG